MQGTKSWNNVAVNLLLLCDLHQEDWQLNGFDFSLRENSKEIAVEIMIQEHERIEVTLHDNIDSEITY